MNQQSISPEILQWLFRVLQPEYIDPRLAYHDVAVTLQSYPSLRPRTRVYTDETGESKLLLCLYGSIPSPIAGKVYKIPIELWIPHEYPIAAPFVYVVPTEKMMLQPGNHVDNSGRCYLPYLASWGQNPEDSDTNGQSTIVKLCESLSKIFSLEPPVFAKPISHPSTPILSQRSTQLQPQHTQNSVPALPPKVKGDGSSNGSSNAASPPPLPPLPNELRARVIQSPTLNKRDHLFHQAAIDQINQRPAFEQPNIMDTEAQSNGGGTDAERAQILSQLQELLQQINQYEIAEDKNRFESNINKIRISIDKFDKIFQYEYKNLEITHNQLEENKKILKESIKNAENTITQANSYDEINIDEVICAETIVFNQLYDLVAEDSAISDTIYALGKAHDNGNITLNSFTKHTRNLARDQFLKKALITKISALINLQNTST